MYREGIRLGASCTSAAVHGRWGWFGGAEVSWMRDGFAVGPPPVLQLRSHWHQLTRRPTAHGAMLSSWEGPVLVYEAATIVPRCSLHMGDLAMSRCTAGHVIFSLAGVSSEADEGQFLLC